MEISVKIEADADGYTGRECPICEKYFKIKFGTGLPGDPDCHCPYCNHTGPERECYVRRYSGLADAGCPEDFSSRLEIEA